MVIQDIGHKIEDRFHRTSEPGGQVNKQLLSPNEEDRRPLPEYSYEPVPGERVYRAAAAAPFSEDTLTLHRIRRHKEIKIALQPQPHVRPTSNIHFRKLDRTWCFVSATATCHQRDEHPSLIKPSVLTFHFLDSSDNYFVIYENIFSTTPVLNIAYAELTTVLVRDCSASNSPLSVRRQP
ncbi:hypothetical protein J6590_055998 [Homalodisca vitripennis]|nr:hypothetical protein J6590_055998 [Homalodisca vitripennis]